jgi:hypothetical protein
LHRPDGGFFCVVCGTPGAMAAEIREKPCLPSIAPRGIKPPPPDPIPTEPEPLLRECFTSAAKAVALAKILDDLGEVYRHWARELRKAAKEVLR